MHFNLANSDGVNIYSRRNGDTDFKFLAGDSVPTYIHKQPPEARRRQSPGWWAPSADLRWQ